VEVRDAIHAGIGLDEAEAKAVGNPWVQRLRMIRAVGFSGLPFPGAIHTRFSHSLGVMHVAGQAFDAAYRNWDFEQPGARARFRAAVRLAALCHDLGHGPYSHCSEFAMPPVAGLDLDWYRHDPGDRQASHEDYTIAILRHTSLGRCIDTSFPCDARHVAALISDDVVVDDGFFHDGGLDHRRLLGQIISSELDADRLDYLVRDAYFSGARYGTVDVPWILSNLGAHAAHGQVWLALDSQALWAFEDFLVSRHHMFLQVYFHHKSVIYEEMLKRWVRDTGWRVPVDLDAYLWLDDVALGARGGRAPIRGRGASSRVGPSAGWWSATARRTSSRWSAPRPCWRTRESMSSPAPPPGSCRATPWAVVAIPVPCGCASVCRVRRPPVCGRCMRPAACSSATRTPTPSVACTCRPRIGTARSRPWA